MTVTLGGIAGLIAAIAFLLLVGAVGLPLIKLARIFDELRGSVRELTDASVPILTELESTVTATNDELGKLAVVTEDVANVSGKASEVATNVSRVTKLVSATVAVPFIKAAAVSRAGKRAIAKWRKP